MVPHLIATSIDAHKRNRAQVSDGDIGGLVQALAWWKSQSDQDRYDLTDMFKIASVDEMHDFYWLNPCSVGIPKPIGVI